MQPSSLSRLPEGGRMDVHRKLNSSDFRHWPVRARLALCAGLTVLYVLAFILLQPLLGGSVSALALFPVAVAGWLFGLRGGLLAGVLLLALTIPLLNLTMEMSIDRVLVGGLAGFTVLLAAGVVVGWLSDLRELLRKELAERARVEAALQSERDFAESLIETAQAIVLVLDTEGRIVRFNPYMEEISGYRLDEVQGQDWFSTFLPEHERERIRGTFLNALGDAQTHGNVNAILTKNGRKLLTEWYDKTLKDASGNVVGLLSVGQDVTARVQAEAVRARAEAEREQLLAAEREQRLVAETLTEVTLALTSQLGHGAVLNEILSQVRRIVPYSTASIALLEGDDLHTVRWQKAEEFDTEEIEPDQVLSLTDLPLDDFVVRSQKSVMIPDVRQEQRWTALEGTDWIQSYLSMPICLGDRVLGLLRLNGATPYQFSARDVQRLQPLVSAAAIAIQNARLVESLEEEVTLAISDIIVEKQKTEIILRSVDDAIALSNLDGRIEYINDAYTTLTGYTPEEVFGRRIDFLLLEDVPKQVQQARQAIVEQGEPWREEVVFKRKDGRTYDAELSIAPVYDAKDTVTGFVSSHRDISRRKNLERARNQFITNVSHQLRTPVTTIQLYAHLLQQEELSEKAKQYFGAIKTEAIKLVGLIEDILVMAILESGSVIDTWRPVSIPAVVDSIVSLYRNQARTSGVALAVTPLPPDGPMVNGDQARLAQALGEIVENAIGFTSVGGRVSVDAKTTDDHGKTWIKIAVCDTGPGIPEEEQGKVFDRFFRGSIVETGNVPGTGLGLSIAQEIVRAHGGYITVESLVGAGSTFTIWLPAEDSD
jgi:PAS domain S-box-containing protein